MMNPLNNVAIDVFNLTAINCLEQLGFNAPTEWQIHLMERYLRMSYLLYSAGAHPMAPIDLRH